MITQIQKTLPKKAWEGMVIKENGEPLVLLAATDTLKLGGVEKSYQPLFYVRKTVAEMLYRVSESLPAGMVLVVIEGYRTIQSQQESWDRKWAKLQEENPHWTDDEIERQVGLVIAKPNPLANHHCGGAVDVTLAHADGTLLDMGSPYPGKAYGAHMQKKFPMFPNRFWNRLITREQESNRKILRDAMSAAGFVWYPGEWWHYCWGDRMWALYSERTECYYGPIELEQ